MSVLKCLFSNHWSVFFQNLHNSSVSWKIALCTFVAQIIYTLATRSQLKQKTFLDFSSAQVKICQVHVSFKMTSQFLLKFCVTLHCLDTQVHCKFEAHKFSTLDKKTPSKFQFWHFQVLWWKFAKILMSFSKQQASFFSNFASLFSVMKDNFSVFF